MDATVLIAIGALLTTITGFGTSLFTLRNSAHKDQVESLTVTVRLLQEENARRNSMLADVEARAAALSDRLADVEAKNGQLQRRLEEVECENSKLQQQVDGLLAENTRLREQTKPRGRKAS